MIEWISGSTVSRSRGVAQLLDNAAIYNHRIRERLGKSWGTGNLSDWWLAEETNKTCVALGIPLRYPELKQIGDLRDERAGIVAPSVHGLTGFATSAALKRKERAVVTVAKRQRLQDSPATRTSTESVITHVTAAARALGNYLRGADFRGARPVPSSRRSTRARRSLQPMTRRWSWSPMPSLCPPPISGAARDSLRG